MSLCYFNYNYNKCTIREFMKIGLVLIVYGPGWNSPVRENSRANKSYSKGVRKVTTA